MSSEKRAHHVGGQWIAVDGSGTGCYGPQRTGMAGSLIFVEKQSLERKSAKLTPHAASRFQNQAGESAGYTGSTLRA